MVRGAFGAALACVLCAGPALAQGYSVVGDNGSQGSTQGSNSGAASSTGSTGATGSTGSTGASENGAAASTEPNGAGGEAHVARRGGGDGEARPSRHPWEYGGLTPGGRTVTPGISRRRLASARRSGNAVVAWPGFQMTPQGSRVFVAVEGAVSVAQQRSAGRVVYHLDRAVVPVPNDRRTLETRAFETPVQRAYLRQRGRGVDLVIELRAQVEPAMSQQTASDHAPAYVFVDFPRWTPPAPPPGAAPAEPTGVRPAAGDNAAPAGGGGDDGNQGIRPAAGDEGSGGDTERPPPAQP